MNIHEHMAEKLELSGVYATDGAFRSAARVLRKLADDLDAHAVYCEKLLTGSAAKK